MSPRRHKKLSTEQRLETAKTLDILDRLNTERGAKNELFAQEVCKDFLERGLIECFWAVPKNSKLDRKGIDVVVKTSKGYYFLNIKSSMTGAEFFRQRGLQLENVIENIYPWCAVREEGPAKAAELLGWILGSAPSCNILPPEVAEVLDVLPPNNILAEFAVIGGVGRHEQRALNQIARAKRGQVVEKLRIKLEEEKRTVQAVISLPKPWRSRFARLEHKGICNVKVWDVTQSMIDKNGESVVEWAGKIVVEIFGKTVTAQAVSTTKKGAQTLAAEIVAREIQLP